MRSLTWLLVLLALLAPATAVSTETAVVGGACGDCCCAPGGAPSTLAVPLVIRELCCWKSPAPAPKGATPHSTPPAQSVALDFETDGRSPPSVADLTLQEPARARAQHARPAALPEPLWRRHGVQLI